MNNSKITFIGAGNMASAIITGLMDGGIKADSITAAEPNENSLARMSDQFGVNTTQDNGAAVREADVVVLSVKPQVLQQVCEQIRGDLMHKPLVISIAAGIELESLESWLGEGLSIVRCMPNTPAQVLVGASGLVANEQVTEAQKALATSLFSAVGVSQWLASEDQMHAITALSGSGPAYIFLVIEAMEQAAIKQGIEAATARQFAAQTVLGAAQMVLSNDIEPGQLKRNVMSPGGTTERAIHVLEGEGLPELFDKAMAAAAERSSELAELLKG